MNGGVRISCQSIMKLLIYHFFIWDPKLGVQNETRNQLAQNIDIPATILEFFEVDLPEYMMGKPLSSVIESEEIIHDAALFGYFGSNINVVDGDYIYMRGPMPGREAELHEYTLMPMRMNRRFTKEELQGAELDNSFAFTKGISTLKMKTTDYMAKSYQRFGNKLFNYKEDPNQEKPLYDLEKEFEMITKLKELMKENEAPESQYLYYGLDRINSIEDLLEEHKTFDKKQEIVCENIKFSNYCMKEGYLAMVAIMKEEKVALLKADLEKKQVSIMQ